MIDFRRFEALTFDCYGTLIDWESGIIAALRPVLSAHGVNLSGDEILERYAQVAPERDAVEGGEYMTMKEVLRRTVQRFGERLGFRPTPAEETCLLDSLPNWKPFADTVEALRALKRRFKLAIVSNIDDDLFAFTAKHLEVLFDWVITAEQARAYKPSLQTFRFALGKIGLPLEKVLHVAQSIHHDIIPAKALGLTAVWVNRRGSRGPGATPPAVGQPDLEVPDLRTLVSHMGLG